MLWDKYNHSLYHPSRLTTLLSRLAAPPPASFLWFPPVTSKKKIHFLISNCSRKDTFSSPLFFSVSCFFFTFNIKSKFHPFMCYFVDSIMFSYLNISWSVPRVLALTRDGSFECRRDSFPILSRLLFCWIITSTLSDLNPVTMSSHYQRFIEEVIDGGSRDAPHPGSAPSSASRLPPRWNHSCKSTFTLVYFWFLLFLLLILIRMMRS
jgi:hypothetical protein